MKKHSLILGLIILFTLIGLSGCTTSEQNDIEVKINSYYSLSTDCYITVDGIKFNEFTISMFDRLTFYVDGSEIPNREVHNVTIHAHSSAYGDISGSCDEVTKSVDFSLGALYSINCIGFE
jgi:hypothetical protein